MAEPDERLRALEATFEAGDYRAVREGVAKLVADPDVGADVKTAARALRSRTEPSRAQVALLVVAALLVASISTWAIATHRQGARRSPAVEHAR